MEPGSWKSEAALGALVVGMLVAFVWLTFEVGGGAPSNASRYVLRLDSALGLSVDNTVAIAGVKVGVVDSIMVDGRQAKVTVAIQPNIPLHQDARAALRQKTLLGEKYVDLDPGAEPAPLLIAGAVLSNNVPTVEIDRVIRDVSTLVDRLNNIAPPLESAVARVDTLLQGEAGENLEEEVISTLADVRNLVKSTNKLVQGSSGDVAAVFAMLKDKGPALVTRLESASGKLDDILGGIDPKMIENAAGRIGPAAENVDKITGDMRVAMTDFRTAAKRLDTVLARMDRTLAKVDGITEKDVREFLQVQGVRVNLIPDATVTSRIKKLRDESVPLPE